MVSASSLVRCSSCTPPRSVSLAAPIKASLKALTAQRPTLLASLLTSLRIRMAAVEVLTSDLWV